ncbi:MAG: Mur ligase family protein [Candidatus Kariarchaeaceae archaeon]|jgi:UDP-N-acetylmuramyl tripeptide synthase
MAIDIGYRVLIEHFGYYGSPGYPYVIYEIEGDPESVKIPPSSSTCAEKGKIAGLEHLILKVMNNYLRTELSCLHDDIASGKLRRLPRYCIILPITNRVLNAAMVDLVLESINKGSDIDLNNDLLRDMVKKRQHSPLLTQILQHFKKHGVLNQDTEDDSRLLAIGEGQYGIVIQRQLKDNKLRYLEPPYPLLDLDEIDPEMWKSVDLNFLLGVSSSSFDDAMSKWPLPQLYSAIVPKHLITGTNGKTTTSRILAHILRIGNSHRMGMTSTSGIYIDGEEPEEGDFTGPWSARNLLLKDIDEAVLETARGGLIREGVIFPEVETATVTNVAADHLGLRDIDTVEQMTALKSLVYQAATKAIIINVDEQMIWDNFERKLKHSSRKGLVYWAVGTDLDRLQKFTHYIHLKGTKVILNILQKEIVLGSINEFGFSQNGLITFLNTNAMVALAMAIGSGMKPQVAWDALLSFEATVGGAPGRGNYFIYAKRSFMIDYGHNPHAILQIEKTIRNIMERDQPKRVIYLPLVAGDRRDRDLRDYAHMIAKFPVDIMVFKDLWVDTRGNDPGVVGKKMENWVRELNEYVEIHQVADPLQSVVKALELSREGDLVYICIEKAIVTYETIMNFDY